MKPKNLDRRLLTILLVVFVQMVGASMIFPILPLFAQREFGLSPQAITLLSTSFFVAQFVAGPYLGRLSDKYGRIPILLISQVGTAVSFVFIGAAQSVFMLFAARIVDGITGGNIIVAQAYVTDITPREKRTESLGFIFAVFGVGIIIGPALGGLLAAFLGPRVPYYFAAGVATLTVLLTWLTLDETLTPEQRLANRSAQQTNLNPGQLVQNVPLMAVLGVAFMGQFAFGLLQSTFSLYAEARLFAGVEERMIDLGVGLLLTAVGVGQLLTQTFLLRPLLRRYGDIGLVVLGTLARGCALVLYAVVTSPWLGAVGSLFFAAGMGLSMPPLQSLSTAVVADELRGGILGIFQSVTSLGIIVSTAIAGFIFSISPTMPYWVGAGFTFLLLLPIFYLRRVPVISQMGVRG